MNEAERQRGQRAAFAAGAALPATLHESGPRAARGLEAYRANAETIAARALGAAFPTVQAMVGEDDFRQLARGFLQAQPATRGDLGEWGEGFAEWLGAHDALRDWPWLADSARLDLALHCSERAADDTLDAASLARLESHDPSQLRLELVAGAALVESTWPIVSIHAAHQLAGDAAERAFTGVREALAARRGERAFVARQGWRAVVVAVDEREAAWLRALLRGTNLADALAYAGDGFDFAAWLGTALRASWLKGVAVAAD